MNFKLKDSVKLKGCPFPSDMKEQVSTYEEYKDTELMVTDIEQLDKRSQLILTNRFRQCSEGWVHSDWFVLAEDDRRTIETTRNQNKIVPWYDGGQG